MIRHRMRFTRASNRSHWQHNDNVGFHLKNAATLSNQWGPLHFAGDIATAEVGAKRVFPDFDSYPESVQIGLVDMVFNLGAGGVQTKFTNFSEAVKAKNWSEVAKQSNRPQLSDDRNKFVRQLFEKTAKEAEKAKGAKDAAVEKKE